MKTNNLILMTDSYKLSHWKQYPKGMRKVYSYLESRGGDYPKTMFFGLQYYLINYLQGSVVTMEDVEEANEFSKAHFGTDIFNREGWEYIVKRHGGKLPLRIKAVKEGSVVPVSNVLMTIENTDPNCYWLTNAMETLLMKIWYPITIATNSFYAKNIILKFLDKTSDDTSGLPFKLHDFGYRGVSSEETAGLGAMANLVNFMGTDTLAGITYANKFYQGNNEMFAFSVPASEHSVACSFGIDLEEDYFLNMLEQYPTGIVSIVSDTYNVFNFVETMGRKYKDKILERDGTVVFRPDSGDPVEVNMKLIDVLWGIFGGSYTKNGYKLLDSHVRLIQGDGIDNDMIELILFTAKANGYSADNWVFGSGGGLLQKFDRDTLKFAIKASYGEKEIIGSHGKGVFKFPISKDPVTSKGKRSKGGKLILHKSSGRFSTISSEDQSDAMFNSYIDQLETVFENGEIKRLQTFEEVRNIANGYLQEERITEKEEMLA